MRLGHPSLRLLPVLVPAERGEVEQRVRADGRVGSAGVGRVGMDNLVAVGQEAAVAADLGAATVLMAVIHYKPGANATGYEPDFYVETVSGWVHYPWEPIDSLGSVYRAALRGQSKP